MSSEAGNQSLIEVLVELSPFDRRAVRFDDPVNIIRLTTRSSHAT